VKFMDLIASFTRNPGIITQHKKQVSFSIDDLNSTFEFVVFFFSNSWEP